MKILLILSSFVISSLFTLSHAKTVVEVAPPKDREVCFSPEENCDLKLIKFVTSASKSLDIAIFDLTLDQLAHQILVQSKKIPVRVLADNRQAKGSHSLIPVLIKGGVSVRYGKQRGIMHHKFVIVDAKAIETGSFNYSNNAYKNNQENQLYIHDPVVVRRYQDEFERMWKSGRLPKLK